MTNKQKELRKQRIKNILLKTLHIICYILSLLFILVCIIGGVQSCNNKNSKVNVGSDIVLKDKRIKKAVLNNNVYYVYKFKHSLNSSFEISRSDMVNIAPPFIGDIETPYDSEFANVQYYSNFSDDNNFVLSFSNSIYTNVSLCSSWKLLPNDAPADETTYKWTLKSLYYSFDFDTNYNFFASRNYPLYDDPDTYTCDIFSPYLYISDKNVSSSYLDLLFEPVYESTSLIFNKQWNYNAPLNTTIQGVYGTTAFTNVLQDSANIVYDTGCFVSNNQVFNQIKVWYFKTGVIDVLMTNQLNTSVSISRAPSDYYVYAMTQYINTLTNYSIVVNVHDQLPYKTSDGGSAYYYANSSTWRNDSFRYITFLEPLSDDLKIKINAFNNNNQNYYSGQIYADGGDVFTLLSLGFSSLSDFWAIQILPGISIGVLFFLPAVVGVIVIIVHLLRK